MNARPRTLSMNHIRATSTVAAGLVLLAGVAGCKKPAAKPQVSRISSALTTCSTFTVTHNSYDGPEWWGTFTFRNDGPNTLQNYKVEFDVPAGSHCTAESSAVPPGATLTPLTGSNPPHTVTNHCTFTWTNVSALAPGASKTFNYSADTQSFSAAAAIVITDTLCQSAGDAVLLVVGNTSLTNSDTALVNRLQALGTSVTVVDDNVVQASNSNGKKLVVVSESADSVEVGGTFDSVAVPVIAMEPKIFDDMHMTGPQGWDTNMGTEPGTSVTIVNPQHPLAGGLSGTVAVASSTTTLNWGKPSGSMIGVATIPGLAGNKFGIFAYEKSATMVGATAPARRVGFFAHAEVPAIFTNAGGTLFAAAAEWALGRTGQDTLACAGLAAGAPCNDQNPITQGEQCVAGSCRGGSIQGGFLSCPDSLASQSCAQNLVQQAGAARKDSNPQIQADLPNIGRVIGIPAAVCGEAQSAITNGDMSWALVALSMVGEMRTSEAQACLTTIVNIPWPTSGTCIADEAGNPCVRILEQENVAMAQTKALEGFAFLRTASGDAVVLDKIANHPDDAVRARAVVAYLWNQQNSPAARSAVTARLGSAPTRWLDQFFRESTDTRASFNAKVANYVSLHPEVAQVDLPPSVDCTAHPTDPNCLPNDPPPPYDGGLPGRECPPGLVTNDQGQCVIP
jgi:hypothetical protein